MIIKNITFDNSLSPEGLYSGQTLNFGSVNYFIGKNGTGKTQVLKKTFEKAQGERATILSTNKGMVIKYLPAGRSHTISGSRNLHSESIDDFETNNMAVESFFQFLNTSPFTKTLVEHQIKEFFHKDAKIKVQGQNISFSIYERFTKKIIKIVSKIIKKSEEQVEALQEGQIEKAEEAKEEIEELQEDLKELNLSSESDGMKEMFVLLTFIYHPRVKVLFIDEPETHLHPHMINFITDAIQEMAEAKQKQFFIITHSPIAIKLVPSNEWKYFFFKREEQIADCKISCFDEFDQPDFKKIVLPLNPYKKEAFYSETIILLEGMEDHYLFSALTKKLNYADYDKGGFSFFPCWGAKNLETYYNFFTKTGKKVYVIADANIGSLAQLQSSFKEKFTSDPDNFTKLSKNNIGDFCVSTDPDKIERILKEVELIDSASYSETNYTEIIDIIKKILGTKQVLRPNDEFSEMVHRMVNELQMRFSDKEEWKQLLFDKDIEKLKNAIEEDSMLNAYWQDSVKEDFVFNFTEPWECKMVFKSGKHQFSINFNKDSSPSTVYPN